MIKVSSEICCSFGKLSADWKASKCNFQKAVNHRAYLSFPLDNIFYYLQDNETVFHVEQIRLGDEGKVPDGPALQSQVGLVWRPISQAVEGRQEPAFRWTRLRGFFDQTFLVVFVWSEFVQIPPIEAESSRICTKNGNSVNKITSSGRELLRGRDTPPGRKIRARQSPGSYRDGNDCLGGRWTVKLKISFDYCVKIWFWPLWRFS